MSTVNRLALLCIYPSDSPYPSPLTLQPLLSVPLPSSFTLGTPASTTVYTRTLPICLQINKYRRRLSQENIGIVSFLQCWGAETIYFRLRLQLQPYTVWPLKTVL